MYVCMYVCIFMYTHVGLFHVQDLTLDESSMEITCTFADYSNAQGCYIVISCSNSSKYDKMNLNEECNFEINKNVSSKASRVVPSDCFQNLPCQTTNIYAYDIIEQMIPNEPTHELAAKCISYTPHLNTDNSDQSTFTSNPPTSVTTSLPSDGKFQLCKQCLMKGFL